MLNSANISSNQAITSSIPWTIKRNCDETILTRLWHLFFTPASITSCLPTVHAWGRTHLYAWRQHKQTGPTEVTRAIQISRSAEIFQASQRHNVAAGVSGDLGEYIPDSSYADVSPRRLRAALCLDCRLETVRLFAVNFPDLLLPTAFTHLPLLNFAHKIDVFE